LGGKTKFWGNNYGYDAWGNLLQKTPTKCGAENLSVTAGKKKQIEGGHLYEGAGKMNPHPPPHPQHSSHHEKTNNRPTAHHTTANLNYSYDQENRITGANGYTYTYDADGNRVKKSNGSTGTLYWYMSPGIVAESDLTGALQSEYVFFDGERVARRDGPTGAGDVFYYFSDHLN